MLISLNTTSLWQEDNKGPLPKFIFKARRTFWKTSILASREHLNQMNNNCTCAYYQERKNESKTHSSPEYKTLLASLFGKQLYRERYQRIKNSPSSIKYNFLLVIKTLGRGCFRYKGKRPMIKKIIYYRLHITQRRGTCYILFTPSPCWLGACAQCQIIRAVFLVVTDTSRH